MECEVKMRGSIRKSFLVARFRTCKRLGEAAASVVISAITVILGLLAFLGDESQLVAQELPDIRSVAADLVVPELTPELGPGLRSKRWLGTTPDHRVYHSLYLPRDWTAEKHWPLIVELTGNSVPRDRFDDFCSGRPEDACLGYGISGGERFIWISLPYLNGDGDDLALTWWGDRPSYDPTATLDYIRLAIDDVCDKYNADRKRIILAGFSRGAIACNYLGLHDDETAKIWKAFIVYSHYDGVRKWPFPESDAASAQVRLSRLDTRRQFVCGELDQTVQTERYLKPLVGASQITFVSTGFRNHSDRWVLRPSPARDQLRAWLQNAID